MDTLASPLVGAKLLVFLLSNCLLCSSQLLFPLHFPSIFIHFISISYPFLGWYPFLIHFWFPHYFCYELVHFLSMLSHHKCWATSKLTTLPLVPTYLGTSKVSWSSLLSSASCVGLFILAFRANLHLVLPLMLIMMIWYVNQDRRNTTTILKVKGDRA